MVEATLSIEAFAGIWRVKLEGPDGVVGKADVPRPTLPAGLTGAPNDWSALVDMLSPLSGVAPRLYELKQAGRQLWSQLLQQPTVADAVLKIDQAAREQCVPVRLVLEMEDDEVVALPIELAWTGDSWWFREKLRGSLRRVSAAGWGQFTRPRAPIAPRVLVATAHIDGRSPNRDELAAHRKALISAVENKGWEVIEVEDTTRERLREALAEGADVLHIACHGTADPDHAGLLHLCDGVLTGEDLSKLLADTPIERRVQVAILCACSSAEINTVPETRWMAHTLVRKSLVAAVGFRAPIEISWALAFTERLLEELAAGHPVEIAFQHARVETPENDPQWSLAMLYGRVSPPFAAQAHPPLTRPTLGRPTFFSSPTPEVTLNLTGLRPPPPQTWFTGRDAELTRLRSWLRSPGDAVLSSVQGEGGVGKTELARKVAAMAAETGLPVAWLQLTGQPRRALVERLIQTVEADFRGADRDDAYLEAELRRTLGDARGLLVLDDAEEGATVEALRPGPSWNVLVTTRVQKLLPGVHPLELGRLDEADALVLLARVTWDAEVIPEPERADAKILVDRLERLPLAIELAGRSLRETGGTVGAYLEELNQGLGRAADDRARVAAVLARSLGRLPEASALAFEALAALPAVGATLEQIAVVLGRPEPAVDRDLRPLLRWSIAQFRPDTGRYRLHAHVREDGLRRAREAGRAAALAEGVARAMQRTLQWVEDGKLVAVHVAEERWAMVRDQVEAWQPEGLERGSGAATAASATIYLADQFRQFYLSAKVRLDWLQRAMEMVAPEAKQIRAVLLCARGDLRRFQDDLSGATADYAAALPLYEAIGDRGGQANVLLARAELRRFQDDLAGAAADYAAALTLYEALDSRMGQANLLRARGELRRFQSDLSGAAADYAAALALYEAVGDRLGQANVLQARGELRRFQDDLAGAAADYAAALPLYEIVGSRQGQANVLDARGDLRWLHSDLAGAAADYAAALPLYEAVGDRLGQANVLRSRGRLRQLQDDLAGAAEDYAAALPLYEAVGSRMGQAKVFQARGDLRKIQDDFTGAARDYAEALSLVEAAGDRLGQANVLLARGDLRLLQNDLAGAARDYAEALALYETIGERQGQANVHRARGDLERAAGRLQEAHGQYVAALTHYEQTGDRRGQSSVLAELARVFVMAGHLAKAAEVAMLALDLGRTAHNDYAIRLAERVLALVEKATKG